MSALAMDPIEDEAAVRAEAAAIVAQAKKDIQLREEGRKEMAKTDKKDDIQALINKRLAQSFADRPKPSEAPAPAPAAAPAPAQPTAADTKAEAAEIVANAKKEYKARLEDREKAKTATPEDLQAMINAKLSVKDPPLLHHAPNSSPRRGGDDALLAAALALYVFPLLRARELSGIVQVGRRPGITPPLWYLSVCSTRVEEAA
eukprot:CAMPEP_0119271102 /NCGR_PEP_ID=MMETSP1329-20130426/7830_1 /TAXON_ID=114041 /ORGANISM="Genus nov. species nov., Strain RCC1024" /LENGTH=202 /DNA_ID=CAMNT_0007271143 /DNA_START=59 /DNA_END=665 /DNA_ORIENTATION=-